MVFLNESVQRVLITGGAGFIGGSVIRRLLGSSSIKIFNLDKLGYASDLSGINNLLKKNASKKNKPIYEFLKIDLTKFNDVKSAIIHANPDLVIHLAAESHVDRSIDNPSNFIESNILGTFNLLEAIRIHWENLSDDRKSTFKMHHISTDEVFGSLDENGSFSETTPYAPRSPYSATKASSDHLVDAWHHTYGLPVITTNCSNNFGPWQFPEKLIPLVITKAMNKKTIPLYGDGSNVRDWLFVDDHVDGILLAATMGKPGKKYCIGGFGEKSNKEVVLKICNLLDKIHPISSPYSSLIKNVEDRPGHDKRYSIDSSLIRNELNWKPNHTFEAGLEKTVEWYVRNMNWCKKILKTSGYTGSRLGTKK